MVSSHGMFVRRAACAALLLVAASTRAAMVSMSGSIDGKAVAVNADFSLMDGALVIVASHEGTRSDYTPAQVLTGILLQLTDDVMLDLDASYVKVGPGSNLQESDGTLQGEGYDISSEWGVLTDMSTLLDSGEGPFDLGVVSSSLGNANDNLLGSGDLGGGNKLGGSDFGLINAASLGNASIANKFYVANAVEIKLVPAAGSLTFDDVMIDFVTFTFGSAHQPLNGQFFPPDEPPFSPPGVPLPAAAWMGGVLMAFIAAARRRRAIR